MIRQKRENFSKDFIPDIAFPKGAALFKQHYNTILVMKHRVAKIKAQGNPKVYHVLYVTLGFDVVWYNLKLKLYDCYIL